MVVHIFDTKKRASSYCKNKNKYARKYKWQYQKQPKGGYAAYRTKK